MTAINHSVLDGTLTDSLAEPDRRAGPLGHRPVRACMTRPGIAVTPETDFATVVTAITASGRGALPVVAAEGAVVGVVAASDLLAAYAAPAQGPARILAGELMSAPAVTVTQDQSVAQALAVLDRHSLHHLPVVDSDGRLVGILSPHDLLDALRRDDEAIRTEALSLALTPGSGVVAGLLHVRCERGHVSLAGRTRTRSDAGALCLQVGRIEGLSGLTDQLRWDIDDTREPSSPVGG